MRREEIATTLKKGWGLTLALLFLFGASAFFGLREFWRWRSLNADFESAQTEIIKTQADAAEFQKELANMSNPVFLEKEARAKLNLKREGELALVVVSENNFPPENFLASPGQGGFDSISNFWLNLKEWRRYFFP